MNKYSYEVYGNGEAIDIRLFGMSVDFFQGEMAGFLVNALEIAESEDNDNLVQHILKHRSEVISAGYDKLLGGE